jgi:hypothetical protein
MKQETKKTAAPNGKQVEIPTDLKTTEEKEFKPRPKERLFYLLPNFKGTITKVDASGQKRHEVRANLFNLGGTAITNVFDEKRKQYVNARIQYVPGESSVISTEQAKDAEMRWEPITFRDGYIKVQESQVMLNDFLDYHPGNITNPNRPYGSRAIFFEAKPTEDAEKRVSSAITQSKVLAYIYDCFSVEPKKAAVLAYLKTLGVDITQDENLVMDAVVRMIQGDPVGFITGFQSQSHNRKYYIITANEAGIINIDEDSRKVTMQGQTLVDVPHGFDVIDYFVKYTFDKGENTFKHIKTLVDKNKAHAFHLGKDVLTDESMEGIMGEVSSLVDAIKD